MTHLLQQTKLASYLPLLRWRSQSFLRVNLACILTLVNSAHLIHGGSTCLLCPEIALDPLVHHADEVVTCMVQIWQLRDVFVDFCHKANLGVKVEAGSTLTPDISRTRPTDALYSEQLDKWNTSFTVTSPLTPVSLHEASVTPGTAALLAEQRKHKAKCHMLGWNCIPLAVESLGSWGIEVRQAFSHLASRLSFGLGHQKPKILQEMYGIALVPK